MLDEGRIARIERSLADAVEHGLAQSTIGGRTLGVGGRAGIEVAGNEIGEGAPDIDGDDIWHDDNFP